MVVIEDVLQIHEGPGMGRVRTLLLLFLCHTCHALEITVPPSRVGIVGTDAVLPCTFKVDNYPISRQFLAIFWHFEENKIARYDSKTQWSTLRFTINEPAVMQGNASLTIHNVTVTDKGKYKCMVIYSPNIQEKQIQLNILAVPVVRIQKKAVQRDVTNILQCSITNFFPNDMKVIWLKNSQILSGSGTQDDQMNADKTFTRNSTINVIFLEEDGNPEITCQVENEYLQHPINDSYIVQYADEWYLVDNEDRKILLHQIPEQQDGRNVNAENQEPPAETLRGEEKSADKGKKKRKSKKERKP